MIRKYCKALLPFLLTSLAPAVLADAASRLEALRHNPQALYAFLKTMPKGGELHYHLAGGAYPEAMLGEIRDNRYCLNPETLAITEDTQPCNGVNALEVHRDEKLRNRVIQAWSMKDFVAGDESGHDHFFAAFFKFMPLLGNIHPPMLADVLKVAASQHALYMEIMVLPDMAHSASFAHMIQDIRDPEQKAATLLANPEFQDNIRHTVTETSKMLQEARNLLECDKQPDLPACRITVKFLYHVLREQSEDAVFAQALNGFAAVSQSENLIGMNLVQAEDGPISLRDYHAQMQIFDFMHRKYPRVPVALHAGELAGQSVPPADLAFHIRDALQTGHARRIGHGSDIGYEDKANDTLDYMARQGIPVEINLTSNRSILNLYGAEHPLHFYLSHKVPVVLSTDDEGVLRTDLTREYVRAVIEQGLDYPTLRTMTRNVLTYSFMEGESIWENPQAGILRQECIHLTGSRCDAFVAKSPKAALQRKLELELRAFEG